MGRLGDMFNEFDGGPAQAVAEPIQQPIQQSPQQPSKLGSLFTAFDKGEPEPVQFIQQSLPLEEVPYLDSGQGPVDPSSLPEMQLPVEQKAKTGLPGFELPGGTPEDLSGRDEKLVSPIDAFKDVASKYTLTKDEFAEIKKLTKDIDDPVEMLKIIADNTKIPFTSASISEALGQIEGAIATFPAQKTTPTVQESITGTELVSTTVPKDTGPAQISSRQQERDAAQELIDIIGSASGEVTTLALEFKAFEKAFGITHAAFNKLAKVKQVKKIGRAHV